MADTGLTPPASQGKSFFGSFLQKKNCFLLSTKDKHHE
jgi:hypothetical protein